MKHSTFAKAALASLVMTAAGAANAQESQTPRRGIDEVVVTAQKRAQNLQDVPIAVTAFSEEELRRTGANSLDQLTEFVAGAELYDERGAGLPVWVIRGVGLTDFNANNTPAAAIYYDEFYLASNAYGGIGLFDVERVEVLKGPQGGLYGRNTTGGAVRIVSARPQAGEPFNGYINGSYGRWEAHTTQFAIGGPAGEKLAWRAAVNHQAGGGWQDTLATPNFNDKWGDSDILAGKFTIVAEPFDNFNVGLKVEAGYNASETTLGYARAVYDLNTADYCDAAQAGRHDPQSCVTWYNVTKYYTHTPGDPGILPSAIDQDGTTVMSNPHNELDNDWISFTLDTALDFEGFSVRTITSYIKYDLRQTFDYDASPLTMGEETFNLTQLSGWSQEIRLQSSDDTNLIWMVGGGYAEDRDEEHRIFNALDNRLVLPAIGERGFIQTTKAWTVFAQAEYELFSRLKLNGSVRYTDETKNLDDAFFRVVDTLVPNSPNLGNQDLLGFFLAAALAEEYENVDLAIDLESNWSGHAGIDWRVADDVMAYAKLTRGFKSGGFYGDFALTQEQLGPYREETTTAWEIGIKSTLFDRSMRINAAAFTYDYRDIQGFNNEYNAANDSINSVIGNIGDGRFYGGEIEAQWIPHFFPQLELTGSLSILDAKITSADTPAINADGTEYDRVGKRIPNAAKLSYLVSASYETEIRSWFMLGASVIYSWRDDLVGMDHTSKALDVAVVSQEAYGLLNARLSARHMDGRWEVAVSGKNLTNKAHWVSATSNGLGDWLSIPNRPTSWTLEVAYNW